MVGGAFRVDEDVVEVANDVGVVEITKDFVHETLESAGCVAEPEGDDHEFEETVSMYEWRSCGGLPLK